MKIEDKKRELASKMARKKFLINDEHEAIKGYADRIKQSKGKERQTYKHIKGEEHEHIRELDKI